MALKNSTKTVTKEAISNSQPRIVTLNAWAGIDITNSSIDSDIVDLQTDFNDWTSKGQTDSPPAKLAIQNNLISCSNGSISTRFESEWIAPPPPKSELSGVATTYDDYVYAAAHTNGENTLWRIPLQLNNTEEDWEQIKITDKRGTGRRWKISSIEIFIDSLIVLMEVPEADNQSKGEIFRGELATVTETGISNEEKIEDPTNGITINSVGNIHSASDIGVSRFRFVFTITNPLGSTLNSLPQNNIIVTPQGEVKQAEVYTNLAIAQFDSAHYLTLHGNLSGQITTNKGRGIDIYVSVNESNNYIFIGHTNINDNLSWDFNWLGSMMESTELSMSSIKIPEINTTEGVDATHIDQYDGRLYFYGGSKKYRLYIGGNPGSELSVATGLGGAFVDIEQGSGQEIKKVLKFKTYNGATTITILTHHNNTSRSSRYNLVEDSIQLTNEYSTTGFHAEKVDSVVGTSSFDGADTFLDGLYAISRYGVYFTTKTQENQNALKIMYCSDAIEPVFTSLLGYQLSNASILCIKDIVYFTLSTDNFLLDNFVFCYDSQLKAWSTRTFFDITDNQPSILKIFHLDSINFQEGIGVITKSKPNQRNGGIYLLPTTGSEIDYFDYDPEIKKYVPKDGLPKFTSFFATHEISSGVPIKNLLYVSQLEINFDAICSPDGLDVWVEGMDLYGRHFKIYKQCIEKYLKHHTIVYLRVDRYVSSFKLLIKGKAYYRLTHINLKCFQQSNSIGIHRGLDTWNRHKKQHGAESFEHHEIKDYSNLKDIILN